MKKLAFSLIATVFMGVFSMSAQSEPKGFMKIDLGFGRISSYDGSCTSGTGSCAGSSTSTQFSAAIGKISETVVSYAFSRTFYQDNLQYLETGFRVGTAFSLPKSITERIGVTGEFIIAAGTYRVTEKDGAYYVSFTNAK
ncbi:MAG TPA: hypothetical protein VF676_02785 [Flavobacterium sp.]|jgi:hypothetical protein